MPRLSLGLDCYTYKTVRCYVCNVSVVPDDQEVILSGKRYICVCLSCAIAVNKKKFLVSDNLPSTETLDLMTENDYAK